ncbi:MAG: HlyD family secretion protein [Comamonas sp.]
MSQQEEPSRPRSPDAVASPSNAASGPAPAQSQKVRTLLSIAVSALVVGAIVWLYGWWTEGRFLQSTNNAFLEADSVAVAPRVGGHVTEVLVQDNQTVAAGQPLVRLDNRNASALLAQAQAVVAVREADIAAARANIGAAGAQLAQARAQWQANQRTLAFAQAEVERFAPLVGTGADTQEHLESLQHQRDQARAQLAAARAQAEGAQSQAKAAQAQLAQAQAGLRQAQADEQRARIPLDDAVLYAPIAGRVGDRTVRVGQVVGAGTRLLTLVPMDALYLTANFKETQMQLVRPGQPVEITVDALGGEKIKGEVESISPGTGAQFALLPAENATGNFTKIVQRVTVRIRLQPTEAQRQVLVPGMSAEATVDTRSARDAARGQDR